MSTTTAGVILVVVLAGRALAAAYRPFGDYMYRVDQRLGPLPGRAGDLPGRSGSTRRPSSPGASTPAACWPSRRSRSCSCTCSSGCRTSLWLQSGLPAGPSGPGVEHRGQLRDQHELAVLLRRVDDGPPGADGRAGGAELRLGRGRHAVAVALVRGFARSAHRPAGQLLGGPGPDRACGSCCRSPWSARSSSSRRAWCRTFRRNGCHHAGRRRPAHHRRPGGQPGGHQGARHQRRRLLQRQLRAPVREPDRVDQLAARSSCCW